MSKSTHGGKRRNAGRPKAQRKRHDPPDRARRELSANHPFKIPDGYEPLPVSAPATWLLRVGWAELGPIGLFEVPGPLH